MSAAAINGDSLGAAREIEKAPSRACDDELRRGRGRSVARASSTVVCVALSGLSAASSVVVGLASGRAGERDHAGGQTKEGCDERA